MKSNDFFSELIIFELANNHQGDVDHGVKIIEEMGKLAQKYQFKAAMKLQLRSLAAFIHPNAKTTNNKHVDRFRSTELSPAEFQKLVKTTRKCELIPMATVFDEASIELFQDLDFSILKIASCSVRDIPLLQKLSKIQKPTVMSSGGVNMDELEKAIWTIAKNSQDLAIMHCVSLYPTNDGSMNLNRLDQLQERFPGYVIGFSTHESPSSTLPVQIAVAKGARLFEKHVAVGTDQYNVNAYSAVPVQVDQWLNAIRTSQSICSPTYDQLAYDNRCQREQLGLLERGVFAKRDLFGGETALQEDFYFAFPRSQSSIPIDQFGFKQFEILENIKKDTPVFSNSIQKKENSEISKNEEALFRYSSLIHRLGIKLAEGQEAVLSCHLGIENYKSTGALLITLVNQSYCKKLIVMLGGQFHPEHVHLDRDESLRALQGDVECTIDGRSSTLKSIEYVLIKKGTKHSFLAKEPSVIEEITSRYTAGKSVYSDKKLKNTKVKLNWIQQRWQTR